MVSPRSILFIWESKLENSMPSKKFGISLKVNIDEDAKNIDIPKIYTLDVDYLDSKKRNRKTLFEFIKGQEYDR